MNPCEIALGGKIIGPTSKVFVIAEAGINHDGSLEQALRLVDAAADCGADAIKFQTFRADKLMVPSRDRLAQQESGAESAFEMFRRLELSWDSHLRLKARADERGLIFLSTPFDEESVDFLDSLGVPAFKIASSDLTHRPLLLHVASRHKPVLLSTGMSHMEEVAEAVATLHDGGAGGLVLLHCVSSYPAPPATLNLRAIQTLQDRFACPAGFSDHSEGILFALVAAALGARVVEKHFTLDRELPGPDHKASINPAELKDLVLQLAWIDASLGTGVKQPAGSEEAGRRLSRRSVVAAVDIAANDIILPSMLTCKRPAGGIEPRELDQVVGIRARRHIAKDHPLCWEDVVQPDR
jgi:N,N'-diacetyllegionaminate synthase